MRSGSAFPDPGPGGVPARSCGGDPLDWDAYLDGLGEEDEPPDPDEEYLDPEHPAMPPGLDLAAMEAETRQIAAEQAADDERLAAGGDLAAIAAATAGLRGRRGPGLPGSARRVPGQSASPGGGFGAGQCLDVAPGGSALHGFAERIADEDGFARVTDDELLGVICALDRAEAAACSLKLTAVAELIRRRPAADGKRKGPVRMPEARDEFVGDELRWALAETRYAADAMLDLARDLETKLPGTREALRSGMLRRSKAEIIARATALLDPAEAQAAEALVLDRAARLTPGGLQAAIARAVIEVAPDKARKRREHAARDARVERFAEYSGNACLSGRELPPAKVLAADQRITWWAEQLKNAGLEGGIDELRAQAYLDLLLNLDSRPGTPAPDTADGDDGPGPPHPAGQHTPPGSGVLPAGFAGRNHLTIPLATLLGLAERPGEITGIGPVDPALARDLAEASAANLKTTWCLTVTDGQGHAIGHGCARPEPRKHQGKRRKPRSRDGPGFTFTPAGQPGPAGGYGTWRFTTGLPGRPALLIVIDPIALDTCDHRFQARGHDPGVKLRHLSQIRHATCTGPMCRRPSARADFEHNTPYEQGGRSCLCNAGPKCRHEHRLKQDPRFTVTQPTPGTFRWTAPSGRQYTTEPTRYPI